MISRIEFVHNKNFIHRDIKPDNFLMGIGRHCNKVTMFCVEISIKTPFLFIDLQKYLSTSICLVLAILMLSIVKFIAHVLHVVWMCNACTPGLKLTQLQWRYGTYSSLVIYSIPSNKMHETTHRWLWQMFLQNSEFIQDMHAKCKTLDFRTGRPTKGWQVLKLLACSGHIISDGSCYGLSLHNHLHQSQYVSLDHKRVLWK